MGEQQRDKIRRVRPWGMARELRALPRPHVLGKCVPQLRHLLANSVDLRLSVGAACKMAQILDVLFQAVDLPLTASLCRRFFSGRHHVTSSMACAPQICRTDSISSAFTVTRCVACSTPTHPSGECNSNSTRVD